VQETKKENKKDLRFKLAVLGAGANDKARGWRQCKAAIYTRVQSIIIVGVVVVVVAASVATEGGGGDPQGRDGN